MNGQADRILELNRLREKHAEKPPVPYLAIVSGKGGTGKSFLALNAAYSLATAGKKVLLVDFNLQNPNLHIMANVFPEANIAEYFKGSAMLSETVEEIAPRLFCMFGDPQLGGDVRGSSLEQFFMALRDVAARFDVVIFDTAPGIQESLGYLIPHVKAALIVANPEPTSVMDAYVMAKYLLQPDFSVIPSIVINRCVSQADGETAYQNFAKALGHFLKRNVPCTAIIPSHKDVYQSIMQQELLLRDTPSTSLAPILQSLVAKIALTVNVR